MDTLEHFALVRQDPGKYIHPVDAIALEVYIHSYRLANREPSTAYRRLGEMVCGTGTQGPCTAMYLQEPDDHNAVTRVLDGLIALLREPGNRTPSSDEHVSQAWAPPILDAIRQGRPALYLANECNVIGLQNYVNGFLDGLRTVRPAAAREQEAELAAYEKYLQEYYEQPRGQWYKLLRIYGPYPDPFGDHRKPLFGGLTRFAELWDRWKASCRTGAVLEIPLEDDERDAYAYGVVLADPLVGYFDFLSSERAAVPEITKNPLLFAARTLPRAWTVVGEVGVEQLVLPAAEEGDRSWEPAQVVERLKRQLR